MRAALAAARDVGFHEEGGWSSYLVAVDSSLM